MKRLHVISTGVLALGLCCVNAANLESGSYKFAKYSLGSMLADSGDYSDPNQPAIADDAPPTSPANKAMKGNTPDTDAGATEPGADTSDMNNDDTDNEED